MLGGAHLDQCGHLCREALGRRQALRAAAHECFSPLLRSVKGDSGRGCAQASRPLPELYVGLGGQIPLLLVSESLIFCAQNKTNEDLELDLELELDVGGALG